MEKKFLKPSININELSIGDMVQCHPFEYLNKLNSINNYCNKMNASFQSYSSVSRVKLPWKNFNIIAIPEYFQKNYQCNKQQDKEKVIGDPSKMDENEKKFWKEHEQIIKKHLVNRKQSTRPATAQSENKMNKMYAKKILEKDRNNIFLKKILEKGTKFTYNHEELEKEILQKLKNLGQKKQIKRLNTSTSLKNHYYNPDKRRKASRILMKDSRSSLPKQRYTKEEIKSDEFLSFEHGEDILKRYKKKIKDADCSISEVNVKKTMRIIKNMEQRVKDLE